MTHTPGPWSPTLTHTTVFHVPENGDGEYVEVCKLSTFPPVSERYANARLIAAAPALAAALRECAALLESMGAFSETRRVAANARATLATLED